MRLRSLLKTAATLGISLLGLWQQHGSSSLRLPEIPRDLITRVALALMAVMLALIASVFGVLGLLMLLWPGLSFIGLVGYVGVIYATLALLAWAGSEYYAGRFKASLTPKTYVNQAYSAFKRGWQRAQSNHHV
jgi:hypothetical protein